jgi:hypothetical protein
MTAGILVSFISDAVYPMFTSLSQGHGIGRDLIPYERFSIPLGLLCEFMLAVGAVVAAIDLWKLRGRGRKLSLIGMFLLLPLFGFLGLLMGTELNLGTARLECFGIFVFSILAIAYLFLPNIRSTFEEHSN